MAGAGAGPLSGFFLGQVRMQALWCPSGFSPKGVAITIHGIDMSQYCIPGVLKDRNENFSHNSRGWDFDVNLWAEAFSLRTLACLSRIFSWVLFASLLPLLFKTKVSLHSPVASNLESSFLNL